MIHLGKVTVNIGVGASGEALEKAEKLLAKLCEQKPVRTVSKSRIPGWGIALFDPVSIFWVVSFLLGGYGVGMLSTFAGTFGLFLYDPTAIGPIFKILATLPMILVPWFGVRRLRSEVGGESLSKTRFYATLMVAAFILRISIMAEHFP